jgi:hypothetical protein
MFLDIKEDPSIQIEVADGTIVPGGGIGTLRLWLPEGSYVDMHDALYVCLVDFNLCHP